MGFGKYKLDKDHNIIPVGDSTDDLIEWALWSENIDNRRVAETMVGPYRISTVFLGIDHSFDDGIPTLFETMVFKDGTPIRFEEKDEFALFTEALLGVDWFIHKRYATWSGAQESHEKIVKQFQAFANDQKPNPSRELEI